jgi:transposase InsO family protein
VAGCIVHSDRSSQFRSRKFQQALKHHGQARIDGSGRGRRRPRGGAQKVAGLDVPSGTLRPATPVESVLWSAVTGQPHPIPPMALFIRLQPVADGIVHRAPSVWDTHAGKPVHEIRE